MAVRRPCPLSCSTANATACRPRYRETRQRDKAGQSGTHIRSFFAPVRRYQMSDRGCAFRVEAMHRVLQHAIGIGNALMLPHVLEPGIDVECLDEDPLLRGVLIYAPIIGAVAPSLARELRHRGEKC